MASKVCAPFDQRLGLCPGLPQPTDDLSLAFGVLGLLMVVLVLLFFHTEQST